MSHDSNSYGLTAPEDPFARRLSRRTALRGSALVASGLAAAALLGCSGDDEEESPAAGGGGTTPAATAQASQVRVYKDDALADPYTFPDKTTAVKKGGVFRHGTTIDVASMDTTTSASAVTIQIPNIVYNRLLGYVHGTNPKYNPFQLQLEPELARSWENTPDGLTYTFALQPNVKWQNKAPLNGRAFVAADVKFAYERYQKGGVNTSYFAAVDRIDTPDNNTLKVVLKRPSPDFIIALGGFFTTIHPKELVDDGSISKTAVGTGPFILQSAEAGRGATFVKNPDYFEGPPHLDGLETRLIPDPASRLAAFRAGQVERADQIVSTKRDMDALRSSTPDVQVNRGVVLFGSGMGLPADVAPWTDERVRRALALAIDGDRISKIVYPGEVTKRLPPTQWSFVFDQEPSAAKGELGKWWRYDPAEAKKMLQAAGAENLTFTNQYYVFSSVNTALSNVLGDILKEVGVTMKEEVVEYGVFNSKWVGRQSQVASTGAWYPVGFSPDVFFYDALHSQGPGNRLRISNPDIDKWAEEQRAELVPQKRREILRKIWDKELDLMYRLPSAVTNPSYEVYASSVRGLRFDGGNGPSSYFYSLGPQSERVWLDK